MLFQWVRDRHTESQSDLNLTCTVGHSSLLQLHLSFPLATESPIKLYLCLSRLQSWQTTFPTSLSEGWRTSSLIYPGVCHPLLARWPCISTQFELTTPLWTVTIHSKLSPSTHTLADTSLVSISTSKNLLCSQVHLTTDGDALVLRIKRSESDFWILFQVLLLIC